VQRTWSLTLIGCITAAGICCAHQRRVETRAFAAAEICAVEVRNGTEYLLDVSTSSGSNLHLGELDPNGSVSFGLDCAARYVSVFGLAKFVVRSGGGRPMATAEARLKPGETVHLVLRVVPHRR